MVFSSHIFVFYFVPVMLLLYYAMVTVKTPMSGLNFYLTIVSWVFYGWWEPWFVILMWISTVIDYIAGGQITKPGASPVRRKTWLVIALTCDLSMLAFFKYYMFFMQQVNAVAGLFGAGPHLFHIMSITLPAGISFYTFQALSYTIDLYRNEAHPARNQASFSCFIALFPQLIAGPIVRYQSVADQLVYREHNLRKFLNGAMLFALGFSKKILLADAASQVADAVFAADGPDALTSWWGIVAYSFQIYFDFCGYSDMAVGLGRMIGFEFIKNFNSPYHAVSMTDFWRRWHISLSTWIRDYLYIPLGGNRGSVGRTYFNQILSMFLCGVWHGAKWTFILWGVYQAAIMIAERATGKRSLYWYLPVWAQVLVTFVVVQFGWVLFRAPSLSQAWAYWGRMLGLIAPAPSAGLLHAQVFTPFTIFFIVLCALFTWQRAQAHEVVENMTVGKAALIIALFVLACITMFTQAFSPFLYFQF